MARPLLSHPRYALVLVSLALAGGCVVLDPAADLGDCAETPGEGSYTFGQIGIGNCLSGPSDLTILPDPEDPDGYYLAIVNSNYELNFASSSLLTVRGDAIDESSEYNFMGDLGTASSTVELPEFLGRLAVVPERGLGLVGQRRAAGLDGAIVDRLELIDLSDPGALTRSDAGAFGDEEGSWVEVPRDPWSMVHDPVAGFVYSLHLTTHEIVLTDVASQTVGAVDIYPEVVVTDPSFEDSDQSGSAPDIQVLARPVEIETEEDYTLRFVEGTYRMWQPREDGLRRWEGGDGVLFNELPGGAALAPAGLPWDEGGIESVHELVLLGDQAAQVVYYTALDADGLRSIGFAQLDPDASGPGWLYPVDPLFEASGDSARFDAAEVGDPSAFVADGGVEFFYVGWDDEGQPAIGAARIAGNQTGARVAEENGAQFVAQEDWEQAGMSQPAAVLVGAGSQRRVNLYYRAEAADGSTSIALARSETIPDFALESALEVPWRREQVIQPGFAGSWDAVSVSGPSALYDRGRFILWYVGFDGTQWHLLRAESPDGRTFTPPSAPLLSWSEERPPPRVSRPLPTLAYQVDRSVRGPSTERPGEGVSYEGTTALPMSFRIIGGQSRGLGAEGSFDATSLGRVAARPARAGYELLYGALGDDGNWIGATSAGGDGVSAASSRPIEVRWTGEDPRLEGLSDPAFTPGLETPELWLAGQAGKTSAIYRGAARDGAAGRSFELDPTPALAIGEAGTWDGQAVSAPWLVDGPDGLRLYYEGADGSRRRIGVANVENGTASRLITPEGEEDDPGLSFSRGPAGSWDDGAVATPSVVFHEDRYLMWYAGFDGTRWAIGLAESDDGLSWTRYLDSRGRALPVLDVTDQAWAEDGVIAPSVEWDGERFRMWFNGLTDDVARIGYAESDDGINWAIHTRPTTTGDTYSFELTRGDLSELSAIQLGDSDGRLVDDFLVRGSGVSDMSLSPTGQLLAVSNKLWNNIILVDLVDDSNGSFDDANVRDIEAVLTIRAGYSIGSRSVRFSPDGSQLYALMSGEPNPGSTDPPSGPEFLAIFDLSDLEDRAVGRIERERLVGMVPMPRGGERDRGYPSRISGGPSDLALSPDGRYAYVTNFNDNSLSVVDLSRGVAGELIDIIPGLGDQPFDITLSPDGRLAYIANYVGEISGGRTVHSTLSVVDLTTHEVVTTLVNRLP